MHEIHYTTIEPYTTAQMFELINDVNAYPEFVPYCTKSGIINQVDNEMIAFIEINKLGLRKSFTTKNQLIKNKEITIQLVEGPFKSLTGNWILTTLNEKQCEVRFNLSFEFKSKLVELAFHPIFKEVIASLVHAFGQRAKQIY